MINFYPICESEMCSCFPLSTSLLLLFALWNENPLFSYAEDYFQPWKQCLNMIWRSPLLCVCVVWGGGGGGVQVMFSSEGSVWTWSDKGHHCVSVCRQVMSSSENSVWTWSEEGHHCLCVCGQVMSNSEDWTWSEEVHHSVCVCVCVLCVCAGYVQLWRRCLNMVWRRPPLFVCMWAGYVQLWRLNMVWRSPPLCVCVCVCVCRLCPALKAVFEHGLKKSATLCVCVCRLCPALKAVFEHGLKKSATLCVCVCRLCPALKAVFEHGLKKSTIMGGHCHPWLFIEEVCLPASATFFLSFFGSLVCYCILLSWWRFILACHFIFLSVLLLFSIFFCLSLSCLCYC